MRIAYLLPSLANTGPNIVAHAIVSSIAAQVEAVDVFYFDEIIKLDFPCPTHKLGSKDFDFSEYNIVHAHMLRPDRFIYRNRTKTGRTKTVTTIHQDIRSNLSSTYNRLIASIYTPLWLKYIDSFDAAVPISRTIRDLYASRLGNLTSPIYNGVEIDFNPCDAEKEVVSRILRFKDKYPKTVGTYAYLTRRKGIDLLISLLSEREDLGLVIIGEGDAKKELERQANRLKVRERILFLPYLKNPYNYLHYVDVYAMPSRSEGFGLALVEAAFTKTPVVCSDIEVFHEIFDETQVSFFAPENIQSLSQAIDCALLDNGKVREAYLRAKDFSKDTMSRQYLALYKSLL